MPVICPAGLFQPASSRFGGAEVIRNMAAEVVVHSSENLYASNRGHDSLAVFAIETEGRLRISGYTSTGGGAPRGFSVDPSGRWLIAASQPSHHLTVFSLDPKTGMPAFTAGKRASARRDALNSS